MSNLSLLTHFLAMGGYGFYIWLAYSIFLVTLVSIWVSARRKRRKILRRITNFYAKKVNQKR